MRYFLISLGKTVLAQNGILFSQEYSLGRNQKIDSMSYVVAAKNGDILFESEVPALAISRFINLIGDCDYATSIDRYTEKN
jgi:hypothetical protein